eukprot:TRINITY_DN1862_c0_g1_i10.p1 TRINITY_DN1862_c0_g1~~TRINITY_DN1862_c0_g1_i10.p1  ORF type:complete len:641 (-),score=110.36 TRINITY_DN1862_c0_g1_i10:2695-4617(-)
MAGGADLDDTPRWRLSVLFMVVVVLSLAGHIGLHSLEEYFRRSKRHGLKHTLQSLKDELFALGLITLLLIVLQDQIVKMCIDSDDAYSSSYPYDTYGSEYKNRKMLAAGDAYECPKGKESFWSLTVLHEIHILIFLIAVVHLTQAAFSMVLAVLRVRRWNKYEMKQNHDMVPLKRKRAIKAKGSWTGLWIQSFISQFSNSIDGPAYLAIRRLFLEKMELDDSFNFYDYVVDSMEEDFAKLVEFQWMMWLIAAIWILLPWQAYAIIWLPCISLLAVLIVGAKLQTVAIQLATLAYTHYSPHYIPQKNRKGFIARSSKKVMKMVKSSSITSLTSLAKQQSKLEGEGKNTTNGVPPSMETEMTTVETPRDGPPALSSISVIPNRPSLHAKSVGSDDSTEEEITKLRGTQLAEHLAQTRLLKDSASLFWFGKPKIMLRVFQYIYFQSGLLISLLILDEWRGQQVNHLTGHLMYILMIIVCLIVVVLGSLFILPTYAITVAAGAYGPDNVLKKALRRNVNPNLAKKLDLERKSWNGSQDSFTAESVDHSVEDEEEEHGGEDHGHGGHGDPSMRLNVLLQAMGNSQVRKKKLEEQETRDAEMGTGKFYRVDSKEIPIGEEEFQETIEAPVGASADLPATQYNPQQN